MMSFSKLAIKLVIIMLFLNSSMCYGQEQLHSLSRNFNLKQIVTKKTAQSKTASVVVPLNLPFFDDFSYSYKSSYPDVNYWLDSNVYINSGFAIAPISLGVATFDGLNKVGYPYNIGAAVSFSGSADTLTSRPINLQFVTTTSNSVTTSHVYSPADSIYLSFYYQAEGNGEAPEALDSLCLDFFKPNQKLWQNVWGIKGYNPSAIDTNFYRVRIAIADTAYCDSLFQFRFRNKATTSGSLDHWNLDYVQIKDNYFYEDSIESDVAFAYKPTSFLKNYSVIPYRQYDRAVEMAPGFRNFVRNNFNAATASLYQYIVKDEFNALIPSDAYATITNPGILPFNTNGYFNSGVAASPVFTLQPFPQTLTDSTFFTITHIISQTAGDNKNHNDTLVHVQKFSNYYAYDDGTAEQGYYLNTYGAKTALRFTLNVIDTLKAVRIYFDPIIEGNLIKSSSFRLMVWANNGGSPGSLIYKDSLMYPQYVSINNNVMPSYKLTSCLPLQVGTYFIGIQQTTNQPLNIGFDKNTNHKNALYYDVSGNWAQSAIPGSLMINPIMGCTDPAPLVGIKEYDRSPDLKVFPNPAQNNITISFIGNQVESKEVSIISALGQVVFSEQINSNHIIDTSALPQGIYFVSVTNNSYNTKPIKLIISR
jgi:hypothetical protein